MTLQSVLTLLLVVAVLVLIGARQLTWVPLNLRRLWVMPLILLGVGVVTTVNETRSVRIDAPSLGLLAIELVVGAALGAAMGWIARFRRLDTPMQDRRGNVITWQYRTGWLGAALWIGLIGMRIGIDVAARAAGFGSLLTSTGIILAVVGVNRLASAAALHHRFSRAAAVAAA